MSLTYIRFHNNNNTNTLNTLERDYFIKMNKQENNRYRRRTLGFCENLHMKYMPSTYLTNNSINNLSISDLIYNNLRRNASTTSDNSNNNNKIYHENGENNKSNLEKKYYSKSNLNLNEIKKNENLNLFNENSNNEIKLINTNNNSTANNILNFQINQAKEMGYTDNEIFQAFEINNKTNIENENLSNEKLTNQKNNFKPFITINEMVETLIKVQKNKVDPNLTNDSTHRRFFYDHNNLNSMTNSSIFRDDKNTESLNKKNLKKNSLISSIGRSNSFNSNKQTDLPLNKLKRNLTVDFRSSNTRNNLLSSMPSTRSCSLQRLNEINSSDKCRRIEQLQLLNNDLIKKLELSLIEIKQLNNSLRQKNEETECYKYQLKNLTNIQRRLENSNKRIDELKNNLKARELENNKNIINMNALKNQYDNEKRKFDETKNNLTIELERLTRANAHAQEIFTENINLKAEIKEKEELLNNIMVSSKSSNFNDNFQSSNSIINYETIDHNSSLISYQNNSLYNKNNSEFNCVVEALTDRIEKLEADNRELLERQTQKSTCGVCMDNSREIIFLPCLHFTCCKNCSENMNHCSICRLRIMGKIEFFE